jgi:hypothetical protein
MHSNGAELARSAERARRATTERAPRSASVNIRASRLPHFGLARLRVAGRS